jgi:WD40 repeat protein/tRNA A-37 threonylcarbamoyl transferase component Bud32
MEHRTSTHLSEDLMLKAHQEIAQRQPVTLQGHEDYVTALVVLSDGRVVSGSRDNTLKLWDMKQSQCLATLQGHTNTVSALAVLPDGRVVSGSGDTTLKLWDMNRQQCLATLKGHKSSVSALAVLPDGRVVSGSWDNTLKLWDMKQSQCLATLQGHKSIVSALAVLPDGRVVSGSGDKTLKLWDMNQSQCIATLQGHERYVSALAVLRDGRVVSGAWDKALELWDMKQSQCIATLQGHESNVSALAVLPDGRMVSGSADYTLKLWDMKQEKCIVTLKGHENNVTALTVLSDGRVVSGSWDNTLKLWDVRLPAWALAAKTPDVKQFDEIQRLSSPQFLPVHATNFSSTSFHQQFNQWQPFPSSPQVVKPLQPFSPQLINPQSPFTPTPSSPLALSKTSSPIQEISFQQMTLEVQPFASGEYGEIYKGQWHGSDIVCKRLKEKLGGRALNEFNQETGFLAKLNSPYIVRFYGTSTVKGNQAMVMEYCVNGTLLHWLESQYDIPWSTRFSWGEKIAYGLAYLHEQKPPIIHNDLAARNILLDDKWNPKITDFGLSQMKTYLSSTRSTLPGQGNLPFRWAAPERLINVFAPPKPESDLYSYGIVLWEIASRDMPLKQANPDFMQLIIEEVAKKHYRDPIPQGTPQPFAQLIIDCREGEPQKRPTAEQAAARLKHSSQFFQPVQQTSGQVQNYQQMTKRTG